MKILLGCMLVLLFFTGCGDDEVDPSQPVTVRLYSEPALDGLVTSDGRIDTTAAVVSIGDDASDKILRAILSFNVSSIPSGSTIYSATLHVYQTNGSSGNSYGTNNLDAVFVDCISFTTFSAQLYEPTSVVTANFATLSTNFVPNSWQSVNATTCLRDELEQRRTGRLQFKLYHHIEKDNDSTEDSDAWVMGDAVTNRPCLVVTYTRP
ncbi:MAG TPA: DNRLRE domain-containing protein [Spirochaetota bacterium]|nr:DNRLRE domain-containing protein [Spirochaetota bacterium]